MNAPAQQLQWLAAIASAVVMAAGIAFFDWPTFTVLALYWLENVVIGGFTALRILAAGAGAAKPPLTHGRSAPRLSPPFGRSLR
jgi:cytochrome b subunit of formate dehydrogenase